MAEAETPAPKNAPATLVIGTFALAFVIIGSCATYYLWPRGDRLGAIDLRADGSTLSLDAGAGDRLSFRIDTITVGTANGYPDNSSRSRANRVEEELQASKVVVTLVRSDGSKTSTECSAFAGKSTTGSTDADSVQKSGMPLDCALAVEKAGSHTLSAKVTWVPKDVRQAILEVRRQKAGD